VGRRSNDARERHWALSSLVGGSVTAGGLLLLCLVLLAFGGPVMETRVSLFFINLLVVLGLQMFSGNSGVTSFGHISFMALGAYGAALLTIPVSIKALALPSLPSIVAEHAPSFWLAVVIALLGVTVLALVVGWPISRLSGSAGAIATFALLVIVNVVIAGMTGVTGGRRALYGAPRETTVALAATCGLVAIIVTRLFRDSPIGLQLRASREDELVAKAMGVRVVRVRLVAWVLSAAMVALSGVLYAHLLGAFSAQQFYLHITIVTLAMLIVGGQTTVSGAVLGAILLTVAGEVLREVEATAQVFGISDIAIGLILLLVMYFRPSGLTGDREIDEHLSIARGAETT
jgi:branched-chain amino acid transport system ATP-binding protein/branched-chain amino acid transport system permease protein